MTRQTLRLLITMLEEITGIFIIVLNDQFEKLKIILRGESIEQEHDLRCFICTKKIRDDERFNFEKNQHDYYHVECWRKLNNKK
jgi:hypothetical protein